MTDELVEAPTRTEAFASSPEEVIRQSFALAVASHDRGELAEAGTLYRAILDLNPNHADALHRLGVIAHQIACDDFAAIKRSFNDGGFQDVVAGCESLIRAGRQFSDEIWLLFSVSLCRLNNFSSALIFLKELQKKYPKDKIVAQWLTRALLNEARSVFATGNMEATLDLLTRAYAANPEDDEARTTLRDCLGLIGSQLESAGKWSEAATSCRLAGLVDTSNPLWRLQQLKFEGFAALSQDRHIVASDLFHEALVPGQLREFRRLISLILAEKDSIGGRTLEKIKQVARYEGVEDSEDLYIICQSLLFSINNHSKLLTELEKDQSAFGAHHSVQLVLAQLYAEMGSSERSDRTYSAVLEKKPDHIIALGGLVRNSQLPLSGTKAARPSPPLPAAVTSKRLKIVIYSNCHGIPVKHILEHVLQENYNLECIHVPNYEKTQKYDFDKHNKTISTSDICLYQPLRVSAQPDCRQIPDRIAQVTPDSALRISFPYVFNTAAWPIVVNDTYMISSRHLTELIESGISESDVELLYREGRIDFDFEARWRHSLQILRNMEGFCQVKIADFVERNVRSKCLFYGYRHAAHPIYAEYTRQILELMSDSGFVYNKAYFQEYINSYAYRCFIDGNFCFDYTPFDVNSKRAFGLDWVPEESLSKAADYYSLLLRQAASKKMPLTYRANAEEQGG